MESTSPVIDCKILRHVNVLSAHVCRYSAEQSICSVRQSLLRVVLGLAINSLPVDFSHFQFEFINHFHDTPHLVEIAVYLVVQAFFILIFVCFIDTELLVLIVEKHGCYIVIWVAQNMDHINWHLNCIL